MRIAVLGGGNGSFAAAGDFALAGHETRLWRRDKEAVATHRAAGGKVLVKDFEGRHEATLALVTADIGEAVRGAELIVCPAPALRRARDRRAQHARRQDRFDRGQGISRLPGRRHRRLSRRPIESLRRSAEVSRADAPAPA